MRYSGIGGQAVLEGVMMKNAGEYAVAVRKEDGEIAVEKKEFKSVVESKAVQKIPLVRGVINFIDSLVLGIGSLMVSASYFEEEEKPEPKPESEDSSDDESLKRLKAGAGLSPTGEAASRESRPATEGSPLPSVGGRKKGDKAVIGGTVAVSIVIAIAVFMILPYYLSQLFRGFIQNNLLLSLIEGAFRLAIFFAYLILVSLIPDIKRTFMYHGAEHKCINCIEKGLPLTTENVRKSSRFHKRCGTSFLLIVMIVSILIFALIQVDNRMLRLLLRLALLPVVAGLSFEFIRLAGRTDNPVIGILSLPGLLLQRITTKEPDDQQIEVGMQSVEAVFDWKEFLEGNKT